MSVDNEEFDRLGEKLYSGMDMAFFVYKNIGDWFGDEIGNMIVWLF